MACNVAYDLLAGPARAAHRAGNLSDDGLREHLDELDDELQAPLRRIDGPLDAVAQARREAKRMQLAEVMGRLAAS